MNDSVNIQTDIEPDQVRLSNFDEKLMDSSDSISKPGEKPGVILDEVLIPHTDSLKLKQK